MVGQRWASIGTSGARAGRALVPLAVLVAGLLALSGCGGAGGDPWGLGRAGHVFVVSPSGGQRHEVTSGAGEQGEPAWSPDGVRIAYAQVVPDGGDALWTIRTDGSAPARLLTASTPTPAQPAWSPDGRRVAVLRFSEGPPTRGELDLVTADGRTRRRLDAWPVGPLPIDAPSWSPDGRSLVYTRTPLGTRRGHTNGAGTDVVLVAAAGGARRTLAGGPQNELMPRWSPAGGRILFARYPPRAGAATLWTVRPDGGGRRRVLGGLIDVHPAWSPDGRRIAMSAVQVRGDRREHLFVIGADGRGLRRITASTGRTPAWSPDGRQLAYGGEGGIRAVRPDGSGDHLVLSVPDSVTVDGLTWSPDGRRLAFGAYRVVAD